MVRQLYRGEFIDGADNVVLIGGPEPPPVKINASPKTITEALFYEELAKRDPALPTEVKAFLVEVAELGIYPEFANSLNLKVDVADAAKPLNVGYIARNGQLWTNPVSGSVGTTVATQYAQKLADLIDGQVATHDGIWLTTNGKSAPLLSSLLPKHKQAWIDAIRDVIKAYETQIQQEA